MYFFAAALIGVFAAIPALMWARHQNDHALIKGAGWGLVAIASFYLVFALARGDGFWKMLELIGVILFGCFYWFSKRNVLLMLAIGWILHPMWDIFLHWLGSGSYLVPGWYAIACTTFDSLIAAYLFWRYKDTRLFLAWENPQR